MEALVQYVRAGGFMDYNPRAARRIVRRVFEYAIAISVALICGFGIVAATW